MGLTGGGQRDARLIKIAIDDLDTTITTPDGTDAYKSKIKSAFKYLYSNFINLNKSEKERLAGLLNIEAERLTQLDLSMAKWSDFATAKISSLLPPPPPPVDAVSPPPPPTDTQSGSASADEPDSYNREQSMLEKGGVRDEPATQLSLRERITKLGVEVPPNFDATPPGPEIATAEIVSRINTNLIPPIQALIEKFPSTKTLAGKLDVAIDDYNGKNPETQVKNVTIKSVVGGKRRRNKKIGTKKKKHKRK